MTVVRLEDRLSLSALCPLDLVVQRLHTFKVFLANIIEPNS